MGNQLQSLKVFNLGIPFFELDDIIVIDGKHFLLVNTARILTIKNEQLTIDTPYKRNAFFSPELQKMQEIPSQINWKSGYYSLASMVTYCLTGKYVLDNKEELLDKLVETKLYWALMRCLEHQSQDRYYLII